MSNLNSRIWAMHNKQRVRESARLYRLRNADKIADRQKEYREKKKQTLGQMLDFIQRTSGSPVKSDATRQPMPLGVASTVPTVAFENDGSGSGLIQSDLSQKMNGILWDIPEDI